MKVLNLEKFRELPAGTVFAKGDIGSFSELQFKGESLSTDFVCMNPCNVESASSIEAFDRLLEMQEDGVSYPMDAEAFGRDGMFEADALFLVFERADLQKLRALIDDAIEVSPT